MGQHTSQRILVYDRVTMGVPRIQTRGGGKRTQDQSWRGKLWGYLMLFPFITLCTHGVTNILEMYYLCQIWKIWQ